MTTAGLIDIHTHLNMLESSPEEVIARAKEAGVQSVITIGTNSEDHPIVLGLAEKYSPFVYCTLGCHPHDAGDWSPQVREFILKNGQNPRLVAIGEIGLDYYYNNSPKDVQIKAFEEQLELAIELGLPVEIHTRDADEDTANILQKYKGKVKGVLHCFTSSQWLAEQAIDCGWNISISGVVTFKNAESLRQTVKWIPLDRLHVETDAPFLTPVPFRGKKNEPSYVVHTAKAVAELKNIAVEELIAQTTKNAKNLFTRLN